MNIDPTTAAVLALHFERDIVEPDGTFGALLADGVATIVAHNALLQGTSAVEMVDEVAPAPGDVIVDHTGTSAFGGGELERLLETRGIDTVVIAGVATNVIVDGTARDASNRGLKAFVLADCCSAGDDSIHEASLATLGMITQGVITSDDFVDSLRAAATA